MRKRASAVITETPQLKPSLYDTARPTVTEALLSEITRRIVEAFHPVKVILFGSYAYGTPHKDSDVDLLVIMEYDKPRNEQYVAVYEAAHIDFLPMDLLVRTPAEIEARLAIGDFFIKEILEKGKVLYQRDSV